jgi:hypothetical protein
MALKAQWPGAQVARATGDPFEGVPEGDGRDEQDPYARLKRLIDGETALMNRGVTCSVRDRPDTSCCACPKRGRIPELRTLCEIGSEQERIVTELSCARVFDAEAPR